MVVASGLSNCLDGRARADVQRQRVADAQCQDRGEIHDLFVQHRIQHDIGLAEFLGQMGFPDRVAPERLPHVLLQQQFAHRLQRGVGQAGHRCRYSGDIAGAREFDTGAQFDVDRAAVRDVQVGDDLRHVHEHGRQDDGGRRPFWRPGLERPEPEVPGASRGEASHQHHPREDQPRPAAPRCWGRLRDGRLQGIVRQRGNAVLLEVAKNETLIFLSEDCCLIVNRLVGCRRRRARAAESAAATRSVLCVFVPALGKI